MSAEKIVDLVNENEEILESMRVCSTSNIDHLFYTCLLNDIYLQFK